MGIDVVLGVGNHRDLKECQGRRIAFSVRRALGVERSATEKAPVDDIDEGLVSIPLVVEAADDDSTGTRQRNVRVIP
jgi:hypothetical protein